MISDDPAAILQAYETGRGSFRLRARWSVEQGKHGTWTIVVTEIPYQVQKSRLIEQIAQLMEDKKLPLLADVRDEVADSLSGARDHPAVVSPQGDRRAKPRPAAMR